MQPKILTLDIETAPIEAYTWGIWEQNIGLEQIVKDWSILAFCAKWLDSPKLIYEDAGGKGVKAIRDDKQLCKGLRELLDEADLVITQNGIKFDIKKINARMLFHKIAPYSPIRVIDTLSAAKKHFGFTSNKLQWTSTQFTDTPKSSHKKFPGFELWAECLKDNPTAWAEMKKYNKQDVVATEKLYLTLRPWIANHPNLGAYAGNKEHHSCPACGSHNTQRRGRATTQAYQYWRWQCTDCGHWSKERMRIKDGRTR